MRPENPLQAGVAGVEFILHGIVRNRTLESRVRYKVMNVVSGRVPKWSWGQHLWLTSGIVERLRMGLPK
jgi:hypothetical protein